MAMRTRMVSSTMDRTHAIPEPEDIPTSTRKSWIHTHSHEMAHAKGWRIASNIVFAFAVAPERRCFVVPYIPEAVAGYSVKSCSGSSPMGAGRSQLSWPAQSSGGTQASGFQRPRAGTWSTPP